MKRYLAAAVTILVLACNNEEKKVNPDTSVKTTVADDSGFMAWGNEPGWMVEIVPGKHIRYIGDYGKDSLLFPYTAPVVASGDSAFTFASAVRLDSTEVISLIFQKEICTDDADRQHEFSVKLSVRNKMLQGCGDKLK